MPGKKRSTEEDGSEKKKKKTLDSKFGGMTEEEVMQKFLPDHLKDDLDVIFVSTRPPMICGCT